MVDLGPDPFGEEQPKAPAPPKRSLFKSKAKPPPKKKLEGEAVEFFSRADELFHQRLADEEKRRQKHAAKLERKRSSASAENPEKQATPEKRRRMSKSLYSSDEDNSRTRKESTHSTPGSRISHASPDVEIAQTSPTLSSSYSHDLRKRNNKAPARKVPVISLTDSEDDFGKDEGDLYAPSPKAVVVPEEEDPKSDEEEYPELIQAAKERARIKEAAKLQTSQALAQQNHLDDDDFFDAPKIENPIVEIFISSEIEGSTPLMVKRRLLARLKEVKSSWCGRQEINGVKVFSTEQAQDEVFLTYKKKRLFDSTSCHSLGFKLDAAGHVEEGPGTFEGKLHLEAWTEETYDIYQKQEAKRLQHEKDGTEEKQDTPEPEVVEKRLRLILKSKEHGEHKLKARLTTPIAKLIESFRRDKTLPEQTTISLHLDGELLDPESVVGDADLDEDDEIVSIEVHIR